ncbi:hypothetical protein EVAR_7621_1 [Eumeta japonica]|uniref:Uncharacterized protein n=1 Tax=Eumeta variegata TaxID=151549 RepID=A0A4C1TKR1_EUMVA|nr:hypothetical protein EVAR_7621_1 [Eumeta japonica]
MKVDENRMGEGCTFGGSSPRTQVPAIKSYREVDPRRVTRVRGGRAAGAHRARNRNTRLTGSARNSRLLKCSGRLQKGPRDALTGVRRAACRPARTCHKCFGFVPIRGTRADIRRDKLKPSNLNAHRMNSDGANGNGHAAIQKLFIALFDSLHMNFSFTAPAGWLIRHRYITPAASSAVGLFMFYSANSHGKSKRPLRYRSLRRFDRHETDIRPASTASASHAARALRLAKVNSRRPDDCVRKQRDGILNYHGFQG